jgi:hypothetical protein
MDPRIGLDEKRKFLKTPGLRFRPLGLPARSQSLYRVSYPGSQFEIVLQYNLEMAEGNYRRSQYGRAISGTILESRTCQICSRTPQNMTATFEL